MKRQAFRIGIVFLTFLAFSISAWSGELPGQILSNLSSEDFRTREDAQMKLLEWARHSPEKAMNELFRQTRVAENPEVRERCLLVLRELVDDEYQKDGEGYIGIQMRDEVAAVPGDSAPRAGIRVVQVVPDSAADRAGLKPNDVIVELDGKIWREGSAARPFSEVIRGLKPGSKVKLEVLREGDLMDFRVTLGRRPLHADRPFLNGRTAEMEAAERAAKDAYFRRWLEGRKARE